MQDTQEAERIKSESYPVRGHAQVIRRRGKQAGGERAKEQEHETTERAKRGRPSSSRGKNSTV